MTPTCSTTIAGHCTPLTPTRAFLVMLLGTAALLMFHQWWLEVQADG